MTTHETTHDMMSPIDRKNASTFIRPVNAMHSKLKERALEQESNGRRTQPDTCPNYRDFRRAKKNWHAAIAAMSHLTSSVAESIKESRMLCYDAVKLISEGSHARSLKDTEDKLSSLFRDARYHLYDMRTRNGQDPDDICERDDLVFDWRSRFGLFTTYENHPASLKSDYTLEDDEKRAIKKEVKNHTIKARRKSVEETLRSLAQRPKSATHTSTIPDLRTAFETLKKQDTALKNEIAARKAGFSSSDPDNMSYTTLRTSFNNRMRISADQSRVLDSTLPTTELSRPSTTDDDEEERANAEWTILRRIMDIRDETPAELRDQIPVRRGDPLFVEQEPGRFEYWLPSLRRNTCQSSLFSRMGP